MIIPEVHDTTFLEFGTTSSLDSNSRIVEEEVVFDDIALRRSDLKCGAGLFKEAGTDSNFLFLVSTTRSKMSPSAHVFTNVEIFDERGGIAVRAEEGLAADDVALVSTEIENIHVTQWSDSGNIEGNNISGTITVVAVGVEAVVSEGDSLRVGIAGNVSVGTIRMHSVEAHFRKSLADVASRREGALNSLTIGQSHGVDEVGASSRRLSSTSDLFAESAISPTASTRLNSGVLNAASASSVIGVVEIKTLGPLTTGRVGWLEHFI